MAMTPERWRQITEVFHAAVARDAATRGALLDEACAGDLALRAEVDAMLAAHRDAGRFGDDPAFTPPDEVPPAMAGPDALIGLTLGHYRILERLGAGGMGVVFRAHDEQLDRDVAIKVLPDSSFDDPTARARLLREARTASQLNHPHICTIHEVGEAEGQAYIAMELVEGRPLSSRLGVGPLPTEEVLRYGMQLADALAHAHERGVVHRDLKSANVMVTPEGRAKVLDFGLAKRSSAEVLREATTESESLTRSGAVLGTLPYMAPEQLRARPADSRTDVWALGVVLFEMASGGRPFLGQTGAELSSAILRERPAPLPRKVPLELRAVIERCLEKEPGRRYQRGGEVRAALEALQTGATAPWAAWRYGLARRRWLAFAGMLLATVAVVALDIGGLRQRLSGRVGAPADTIRLAVLPFENLTGDPEQEYFSDGLTEEMIAQLGRLHPQRLAVIARTSSMRYKKSGNAIDQIGGELRVDYILEGSARREASRVRITTQLIRVRDQTQVWADSYERELAGILTLQSDVARSVAGSLTLTLLPAEQTRLAGARPVNPEAYEAYLRGRFHNEKQTPPDLDLALEYFELALEKDPNYAPAYTGIASVWVGRNQMGYVPPSEATPKAKAAAMKALELDSTLGLAHYALGLVAWGEWDWETCEREFRRTIELDPNDPNAPAVYSHLLMALKRPEEAMAQIERAVQLDPFNAFFQALYGVDLYFVRRYDEAIVQLQNALKTSPDLPVAHCGLWYAFNMKGRPEQALMGAEGCHGHYGREVKDALARGYSEAGYPGAMRRVADLLATGVSGVYVAPIDVFIAYLHAGQKDLALEWLSKAVEARDPNVPGAAADPQVNDSLRDDPRFQDLLRRTKLPS